MSDELQAAMADEYDAIFGDETDATEDDLPAEKDDTKADDWDEESSDQGEETGGEREEEGEESTKAETEAKEPPSVVDPVKAVLEEFGYTAPPEKIIRDYSVAWHHLNSGTPQEKREKLEQMGVTIGAAPVKTNEKVDDAPKESDEEFDLPEVSSLRRQVEELKANIENAQRVSLEHQQMLLREKISQEVSDFAKGKPYFHEVEFEVAAFVRQGLTLAESYERAIYANPATRAKVIAEQQKEADEARRAAAEKARRAPVPAPGRVSAEKDKQPENLRGFMSQEWDRLGLHE